MPVVQLVSSGIEGVLNQLVKLDPSSQTKLKKLHGKSLVVHISELPWPLLFQFSEHISVAIIQGYEADQKLASCIIELNLDTLPLLQDSSKLTQLIQQEKLKLVGDIYVAQSFSSLMQELDIDWEEQLSVYTGDVLAHQTFLSVRSVISHSKDSLEQARIVWAERLTAQGAIGVKPQELNEFSGQVNSLRSAAERLAARLAILEKTYKA
ncbi:ubiquinone biosynthesis accessory factor UbiJ [Paraglaciecola hydrolytica]|uniref:Ubiquinone biosynthesis accessory factor UbiJ n=1 Tax=Paraglaciecola hydrolytica TaxID=1799789 RepID=A0A136A449_9ALTE|nr:SCP2 sterol-binding domain-containing protein [Paraglaciecola hydrolytica]KXI29900.1 sterol-binding protein [Paraglaciecola hydrolytica]